MNKKNLSMCKISETKSDQVHMFYYYCSQHEFKIDPSWQINMCKKKIYRAIILSEIFKGPLTFQFASSQKGHPAKNRITTHIYRLILRRQHSEHLQIRGLMVNKITWLTVNVSPLYDEWSCVKLNNRSHTSLSKGRVSALICLWPVELEL